MNVAGTRRWWILPLGISLVLFLIGAGPWLRHAEAQTNGTGLQAEYFNNKNLTAPKLTRTDPKVDFSWGKGSPDPKVGSDTFSARWTGQIEAPTSGTYTFYTRTGDGVRLWVNDELLINRWRDQRKPRQWSGSISLKEGERYEIKMEYYENTGSATAQLLWSGPNVTKQLVPQERLFLPDASTSPPPSTPPPPVSGAQRWSDPATWNGSPPQAGQTVTIPQGKSVLLDQSTPRWGDYGSMGPSSSKTTTIR